MPSAAIARLRALFENELSNNPSLYHPIDILRMRTEDWQIRRYLIEYESDESRAYAALLATLAWKKSYGVHDRTDAYFPLELWTMMALEQVGRDKAGHLIGWEVARTQRTFKELFTLHRQFIVHVLEKFDRQAGETGQVIVVDAAASSLFNVDTGFQQFKTEVIIHFPSFVRAYYILDTPWMLNAVSKIILSFMAPKMRALVNFIKGEQLVDYIDPVWIPVAIKGGLREKLVLPEGLLRLEDRAAELGLSEKFVDHFYKTLKIQRK